MYEIVKSYIVYTSEGETVLHIDTDGDLHVMSNRAEVKAEVVSKYYQRMNNDVDQVDPDYLGNLIRD